MFCRLGNTVGPFVRKTRFSLLRQSEVVFVELMGSVYTHQGGSAGGVVEHPQPGSCAEGVPGDRPGCGFCAVFHIPIRGIRAGRDL